MVNNPTDRVPTQEEHTSKNEKNNSEEKSKIQNANENKVEMYNVNSAKVASETKHKSQEASDDLPLMCNGTHDVTSKENIPTVNDCDSNICETSEDVLLVECNVRNELEGTLNEKVQCSRPMLSFKESKIINDCSVELDIEAGNADEHVTAYDTRQPNLEKIVDLFTNDPPSKNTSIFNENSSQLLLNESSFVKSEEVTTAQLVDVELTGSQNKSRRLEDYDDFLDLLDRPDQESIEQNSEAARIKDGQTETLCESVNCISNVADIINTLSSKDNNPETNEHPTDESDLFTEDTGTNSDAQVNLDIAKVAVQKTTPNEGQNTCTEDSLQKSNEELIPVELSIANDDLIPVELSKSNDELIPVELSKANDDLTPVESSKSNDDLIPVELSNSNDDLTPVEIFNNKSNQSDTETQNSNQDLKEKIGNSIKCMFDNNEHLHLNLLEKQNIASLQSNTLKKVNNLFSSFKSYNFSNFRSNEESLSKNTPEVKQELKDTSTVVKNLGSQESSSIRSSPLEQGAHSVSFSSLSRKVDLKHNSDNQSPRSCDEPVENSPEHESTGDSKPRDCEKKNLMDPRETKREETTNELPISKSDITVDQTSTRKVWTEAAVQDGYVLNSELIHTVRNVAPNKSVSLDSSPVKYNRHYDVEDELYLLKETNIRLLAEISKLEEEKNKVRKDYRTYREETDLCKASMREQLLQAEASREQARLLQLAEAAAHAQAKKEMEAKVDKLKKDWEAANKDREAAVMRYVTRESELITARTERDAADRRSRDAAKEREAVMAKLKVLAGDKARLTQIYDDKCTELNVVQRSLDKLTDEVTGKDIKLKWLQSRLDKELETGRALAEKAAAAAEEQSRLKYSEDSQRLLLQEIDVLKKRTQVLTEENNALSLKVQRLEKERLDSDEGLSQCKSLVNSQNETISQLRNQLANMEDLKNQLNVEHERVLASSSEVERVQRSNVELSQDMATCRSREAELLQFTEKLTAKNVRLQSEFSALEAKAAGLEQDVAPLTARISHLETELGELRAQLDAERHAKEGDNKALARLVAERSRHLEAAAKEIEELKSENQILKRKHASTVRELNKELCLLKKKCDSSCTVSNGLGDAMCDSLTLGSGSRTSSCQSLNDVTHSPISPSVASTLSSTLQMEPDRNVIIDRLVELQRSHARVIERAEFLEEHNAQLVAELQKKSRILQNYILREQSGALTSRSMDVNKAEMNKHGGIMASLYSSRPADGGMTLELSLEINRKLQAVLEDTILKNITLKENIDTLGEHIEKLSKKS